MTEQQRRSNRQDSFMECYQEVCSSSSLKEESCSSWGWGRADCLEIAASATGMLGRGKTSPEAAPFPSPPGLH